MIREVTSNDIQEICDIYNYYISNTIITFEITPVSYEEMEKRIVDITRILPFLVHEQDGKITGFTYASKWKGRCAYEHSVESTVYIGMEFQGRGVGTTLYSKLLDTLRNQNFHAVIGGISLPNEKSRKLHEKLGFEKVAHFKEVGYKFDKWIDVGYWQLVI